MKLHLGCFDRPVDGWVNTDVTPPIAIGIFARIRRMDVSRRLPFDDACADAVFASCDLAVPSNQRPATVTGRHGT